MNEHRTYAITDDGLEPIESSSSASDERSEAITSDSNAGAAGLTVEEMDRHSLPEYDKTERQLFSDLNRAKNMLTDKRMKADQAISEWKQAEQLVLVRLNKYVSFTRANELWKIL